MLPYMPNSVQIQPIDGETLFRQAVFSGRTRSRGNAMSEADFSRSVLVEGQQRNSAMPASRWSLTETIHVIPKTSGGYGVYRPHAAAEYMHRQDARQSDLRQDLSHSIELAASKFRHNIRNPEMRKKQHDRVRNVEVGRSVSQSTAYGSVARSPKPSSPYPVKFCFHESLLTNSQYPDHDCTCSCKQYHSHLFQENHVNKEIAREAQLRQKKLAQYEASSSRVDSHDEPRNIFWSPELSFHSYKFGDLLVEFSSLWPKESELKNHLKNSGIQLTVIRGTVLDLCTLSITCGPVRLLKCLIDLSLVRVDQQFENGSGMLHLACLARNSEAMQYLINTGISPKLRDKNGNTADQVCFCPNLKRQMPQRYLVNRDPTVRDGKMVLRPSLQDKDTIFSLAKKPKSFDEIQKKLQMFDFNVNTECDSNGEFLLHIACKGGLSHLPLVMALVKIQGADVELCNADGKTSLMLAAAVGNCVLCDVLMCLFGSNPNKPNPSNGQSALHYAAEGNHRKTVECLIRRGADVNIEDHDGRRPDDIPLYPGTQDDCKEVINFNRIKRLEALSERVRKGDVESSMLQPTDLCVVDDDGYTLLMIAAIYNRAESLQLLLNQNKSTINAQHTKTGMTALGIAAQMGNVESGEVLLSNGANPSIGDMESYLPLHHAVLNNHEPVVDSFLDFFPETYTGLYEALRLTKRSSIYCKLKTAWERRQDEIVTPKLLQNALNGNATELYCLLDEGDNINLKSGSGNWPLYLAVENGHLDVVKLLFEKGGDIRKRHITTGSTVLHIAAKMGHLQILEFLIQYCRPAGNLSQAPGQGHECRRLLDINAVDAENKTVLQLAAEKGFSRMAQFLLHHGATTAILDAQGTLFTCPEYEGVRIMIDSHREQHTKLILRCIADKSKKAFALLQKAWLPRFDHNLRNKLGDTPLMVACRVGRLPVVKYLLESAVYTAVSEEEDSHEDSDADSGVLDPTGVIHRNRRMKSPDGDREEIFQGSGTFSRSVEVHAGGVFTTSGEFTRSLEVKVKSEDSILKPPSSMQLDKKLHTLLQDVNRPKGLFIYHEGYVSHISAVNLYDGCTPLHRAIEGGDNLPIIKGLLSADITCLNVQNDAGFSPLHLACKLGRKKTIEAIVAMEGIDLNSRTLDGHLPEEMTTTKNIIRMVQKARLDQSGQLQPPISSPVSQSPEHSTPPSTMGSTINFDRIQTRYEALKKEVKAGIKS